MEETSDQQIKGIQDRLETLIHRIGTLPPGGPWVMEDLQHFSSDLGNLVATIQKSEEKYRTLFETMAQGVIYQDAEGKIISANPAAQRILGLTFDQIRGRTSMDPMWKTYHEDGSEFPGETHPIVVAARTGTPIRNVVMGIDIPQAQERRWIKIDAVPQFRPGEEKPYHVYVVFDEITEQKRMEKSLRQSEERYRRLFQEDLTGDFLATPEGSVLDCNPSFITMFGFSSKEEALGSNLLDLYSKTEDYEAFIASLKKKRKLEFYECALRRRDGTQINVVENAVGSLDGAGELLEIIGYLFDNTDRKKAEEKTKESEKKYRELYEGAQDGFVRVDMEGRINEFNRAYREMLGYSEEELSELTHTELTPTKWHAFEASIVKEQVLTKGFSPVYEEEYRRKDGTVFPISLRTYLIRDENGNPSGMWAFVRDITKRKEMEEKLRRSRDELEMRVQQRTSELAKVNEELKAEIAERKQAEEAARGERQRFNEVLELLPVYLVLLAPDYHVPFANRFFRERFGKSHGRRCFEYLFGRSEPCEICETYTVLKTMAPHEWEWAGPDGRNYHVFDLPFTDTDGSTLVLEMGIDITERKRTEKALEESERQLRYLSAQRLTAQENERKRVAREIHDGLGQNLTAIKFKVESYLHGIRGNKMRERAKPLETVIPLVQESVREMHRIQTNLRPSILDDLGIVATISWLSREFEATYPSIRVEKQIDIQEHEVPDSLKMAIYRVLQEALTNIFKHSQANRVDLSFRKTGRGIEVSIQDNGRGFDLHGVVIREDSAQGLGLLSMKERVEQSGGNFSIETGRGRGTAILTFWPLEKR